MIPLFDPRTLSGLLLAVAAASAGAQGASLDRPVLRAAATHAVPGDRMVLHIVGEPLLSDTVLVNDRGQVPLPKIGVMTVTPFTIAELEDTLRARYSVFLKAPAIEVVVLRRVSVSGAVNKPDIYFVDVATTLREAIARAGGLTEAANGNNVYILREGNRVDIPNWQSNDTRVADLQSGDQVQVGRKSWIQMNFLPAVSSLAVVVGLLVSLRR